MKSTPFLTTLFLALLICTSNAQTKKLTDETSEEEEERLQWWTDARFGMFIHWGLYALPARHEWVQSYERIPDEEYQKYFEEFDPDQYKPEQWAKKAKKAGMKYAVLTTKHHEGFSLFDTEYSDYKADTDLVKEFLEAFRKEGIKVGFYYSLIDWHHPDFTVDLIHPLRPNAGELKKKDSLEIVAMNKDRDFDNYRTFMFNQVEELMTDYGEIDILWLDFSYPEQPFGKGRDDWHSKELLAMVRELQPGIIINDRLDLDDYKDGFDFITPEQVGTEAQIGDSSSIDVFRGKTFESIQTFSGSWGYHRGQETTWKSHRELLDLLISSVSNGGNTMLNVGPNARGEFDHRANQALDSLADWMHAHSDAVYKCTYAPEEFKAPEGTRISYNPEKERLYLFLYDYPEDKHLILPGYADKIKYAQFLNDRSELLYEIDKENSADVRLEIPKEKPPYEISVVELQLK